MLATVEDVEARLGRDLTEVEAGRVDGLIEEASILVEAHTGREFQVVPDAVRVVTSRMVARVFDAPVEAHFTESQSMTAGPFSQNVKFSGGGSGGSPWLTAADRKVLRRYGSRRGGIAFVELA